MWDMGFSSIQKTSTLQLLTKEYKKTGDMKKYISQFDLVVVDDRLSMKKVVKVLQMHRKQFHPFPLKIKQEARLVGRDMQDILDSTCLLVHAGKEFDFRVSKTESITIKGSVKNIIQMTVMAVCIMMYGQTSRHNNVHEITLATSKSMALPIFEKASQETSDLDQATSN